MNETANMTLDALRDQWAATRLEFADELAGTVAFDDSLLFSKQGSGEDRGVERPLASVLL